MTKRVILARQEDENRRVRQEEANVLRTVDNETGEEEDKEDDEGPPNTRDIWEVVHDLT
jgi:hypothetical protein